MSIRRIVHFAAITVFGVSLSIVLLAHQLRAQPDQTSAPVVATNSCVDQTGGLPFTADFQAAAGSYSAYVRLGQTSQQAQISLTFQQPSDASCQTISSNTTVSGETWTKVGVWHNGGVTDAGTFQLQSLGEDIGSLEANRPTVMLVSEDHPECQPTKECSVTVSGRIGVVRPAGTLKNEDSLYVVNVVDPAEDQIQRVDYYVDNKAAYTASSLKPFNLHYVEGGQHTLTSNIIYASGQRIVITDTVDRGFADGFNYFLFSIVYGHSFLLQLFGIGLLLFLVAWVGTKIARYKQHKKAWKVYHGFIQTEAITTQKSGETLDKPYTGEAPSFTLIRIKQVLWFAATTVTALVLVIVVNSWLLSLFQVDGPSMQDTLHTGQWLGINKVGKTWARLSHQPYVPKRGEIVVFQQKTDPLSNQLSPEKNYVVKRVIGLPGERITVHKGVITVYNLAKPEGFQPDSGGAWAKTAHFSASDELNGTVNVDITLGPGELFVMGDNRPESVDSRSYGAIDTDQVSGNVFLRLLPIKQLHVF